MNRSIQYYRIVAFFFVNDLDMFYSDVCYCKESLRGLYHILYIGTIRRLTVYLATVYIPLLRDDATARKSCSVARMGAYLIFCVENFHRRMVLC